MPANPQTPGLVEKSNAPAGQKAHPTDMSDIDCYCGLGPACHLYQTMTPEERAACTADKRQTAQWLYMNGLQNK